MMERHWTIMNQLVESGQSKNVIVRYNTNLSRITYKEYDLYKLLPHFKKVNICASIDGVEEVGAGQYDGVWVGQKDVGDLFQLEELVVLLQAGVNCIDVADLDHVAELADDQELVALDHLHREQSQTKQPVLGKAKQFAPLE